MNFGSRLKEIRNEKNISQEELANTLGITRSSVANYETNRNFPTAEILSKIADILNCTIDYLIGKVNFNIPIIDYINDAKKAIAENIVLDNLDNFKKFNLSEEYIDKVYAKLLKSTKDIPLEDNININISELLGGKPDISENELKILEKLVVNIIYDFIHLFLNINLFFPNSKANTRDNIYYNYPELNSTELEKLCFIMKNVNSKYFLFNEINNNIFNIPIVTKFDNGKLVLEDSYIEGYLPTDPIIYGISNPNNYFYLKVYGNSMNKILTNESYVLVQIQNHAENDDFIVYFLNSCDDASIRKYRKINNALIALEPQTDDPSYNTLYVDINSNFNIIGKAIGYLGKF